MINKLFLDLNNFKPNLGSVERGDSIELNIKLLNDEDYSRSKFRLLGAKSDGKSVEQIEGLNLEDKDLKVVLEDQFVNCEGIVKLELNVVSGETEITTKEFYFFVSNTMNAEIIDSADSIPTLEKVSKYVDDAVNNLDALKEASADIALINGEFKENEIKRKANEMLREKNEKSRLQSEDIRITEEEEREANELERIQAENDRKVDESNRKLAENTRVTNERAREEAELSRQSTFEENEEIRNSNENLRIASEKERIKFNNKAKTDEVNRKEAETKRVEAEKTRVIAEDERKKAETSRQEAEDIRQNTYTNFNEAEEERRNNEISRQEAEALRIEAEKRRDDLYSQKEEERNAAFLESERTRERAFNEAQFNRNEAYEESERVREEAFKVSEATRNEEEEGRAEAEVLRVEAEKLRVAGEENRNNTFTQSEEERKATFEEAENDRKVAESKRVKAESSRVEAEKLRVAAETGRVEAENLRVTAEEERVAAETKREEGFNKFEGKINANTKELKAARSATTGEEFNSLDERIDHEVDRLNKKIDVTMLQQEDRGSHVVENTVEGMTTDMVVKGKTLVNIVKSHRRICAKGASAYFQLIYPRLKAGTYTVILNASELTKEGITMYDMISSVQYPYGLKTGLNIRKIDVREEGSTYAVIVGNDNVDGTQFMLESLLILEGDWTNKPIPEYFEGIKSFGQEEDKISILSHGKNFFNINEFSEKINEKGELEFKAEGNSRVANYMQIYTEKNFNSKIIFHGDDSIGKEFTTVNQEKYYIWIGLHGDKSENKVWGEIILPKNTTCYYSAINEKGDNFVKFKDIQIEIGTSKTHYEHYKEDKKDILLQNLGFDKGLRGIDNTQDELNSIKNKAIKRIEKVVVDGTKGNFVLNISNDGLTKYLSIENVFSFCPKKKEGFSIKSFISNRFISENPYNWLESDCIYMFHSGNGTIRIRISSLNTIEEYKEELKKNPITIYYDLAEPIEVDLNTEMNTKVFDSKTYISFENNISGTSSFKAPVDTTATITRLNRENRALEEENRSLRQDFESTTLSLTDSDLELVKQNVDMDFRLMEVEFALDIPQAILSSNIKFKNKKGEVKSMARTPYEMMKIVILSGDYDREDYMHKVGKYYERGRMTKEEHDELMSLMTADEVISK
ncbi:hypothetical protein [Clostridium perfringens]|uniref:hypothetical protein n=1 Tax=Clostridium perfringens TaxID=1502 RepID=UPI001CCF0BCF|nr:hypothetical protein [Clostridium perfringens]UBL05097.1 hypothetical protein KLF33_06945 [Clostridium perfringens]